jgi:type II secretory pathway component GspD/PulD (secretin)
MNVDMKRLAPGLIFGSILWIQVAACFAQNSFDLNFSKDLISLNAENAELRLVLQELSTQIGFKLWISDDLEARQVSLQIEKLSIGETLRRLLADNSHALVYDDNATVIALYVLPPGEAQSESVELGSGIDDTRLQLLQNALISSSVRDDIKAAMLNQFNGIQDTDIQPLVVRPAQTTYRIIEVLEKIGSANPETLEQLRNNLELNEILQPE